LSIAFLLLSATVLLANGVFVIYANIQREQESIRLQQLLVAQDARLELSGFFEEKYQTLESTKDIVDLPAGSQEQRELILESLLAAQPAFRQVILLDEEGEKSAEVSRVSLETTEQFNAQLQKVLAEQTPSNQRFRSEIYFDVTTNEPLMILGIPINIWGFQGTLAAEVNLEFMYTLVDQLKVGETGYVYIVDDKGNLIAYRDVERVLSGENVSQISEVAEFVANPVESGGTTPEVSTYLGLVGENVVGAYIPLSTPPWAVVTELPTDEAYAPITQTLRTIVIAIIALGFLAGLAGVLLARRLSVPLVDLTGTATRIANGETELRADVSGAQEVVILASAFNTMTDQLRGLISNLEGRVQERTNALEKRASQLEAVSSVAHAIASVQSINTLLPDITRLVSENFGFYHTGIFLLDEKREFAVLQAANSDGGVKMIARNHKLNLDNKSIVGYATSRGEPRIALDVGTDAVFFDNPDLPDTRSEMALPLRIGQSIIGALDVQSTEPNAFTEEDVNTLSTLADQIAIAIENARLFNEAREALAESEASFSRYIRQEWSSHLSRAKSSGYVFDGKRTHSLDPAAYPQESRQIGITESFMEDASGRITVPIKFRGETIGFLDAHSLNGDRKWTPEDISLLEAAAERTAIALENARLVDSAQRRASREQAIGDISTKIGAISDLDAIIQTAVEELGRKIGRAAEVTLELNTEEG
jgi:GAF domain-containing protein/HAMP domain-containing protein